MMRVLLLRLALLAIALGAVLVGVAGETSKPVEPAKLRGKVISLHGVTNAVEVTLPSGRALHMRRPASGRPTLLWLRGHPYRVYHDGRVVDLAEEVDKEGRPI